MCLSVTNRAIVTGITNRRSAKAVMTSDLDFDAMLRSQTRYIARPVMMISVKMLMTPIAIQRPRTDVTSPSWYNQGLEVSGRTATLMSDMMPNIDASALAAHPRRVLFDSWARRVKRKETESFPIHVERTKMRSVA
jgi:hypothetical protein